MRTIFLLTLLATLTGCLPEEEERCYNADDPDRPIGSHLVLNEATGTCVRVDGTEKDASTDRTVIDDSVPECSDENACTDKRMARCDQGTCEKCTDSQHCKQFTDTPVCNSNGNCVECIANNQCDDASASRCFGGNCAKCESDTDCSHIEGKGICSPEGTCVECTAEKDTACGGKVCILAPIGGDQEALSCSTEEPGSASTCAPCVSSEQCEAGKLCVSMKKDDVELGNFCLWQVSAEAGPNGDCLKTRPYIQAEMLTPVEGGDAVNVCSLALSTCQALGDFRMTDCMTLDEAGDALCGAESVSDGYCVKFNDSNNQCTVPCSSKNDCKKGHLCVTGPTRAGRDVCELDAKEPPE